MTNAQIVYWAIFNGNNLATIPNVQIYSINPFGSKRTLSLLTLARRHARKLSSEYYTQRQVYISLYITAPSRQSLEATLDNLLGQIQASEGTLVISQSGGARQYTCTLSTQTINNPNPGASSIAAPQGGFLDLTLCFECSDSFGYDTNYTLIDNQIGLSSNNVIVGYTQGGGAETQVPVIQVKFTGAGSNTGTVIIGNNNVGQAVSVTTTFNQYDILTINSQLKTVQINGVDVNFSGAIPEFSPGFNQISYNDNFTSRTFNLFAYVYNRWN